MTPSAKYRIRIGKASDNDIRDDEAVVVIDNLRASSTIVTALWLGVELIIPVLDDNEAFSLKKNGAVIAGESGCKKIDGYDLGNSPVDLQKKYLNKPFTTLVLKTSNLIPLLVSLPRCLICSSLNLAAVAAIIKNTSTSIISAGGPHGSAEDLGVAFALGAHLSGVAYNSELVIEFTRESNAAKNLIQIGYAADVDFISRVNVYDVVPYYDGRCIRKTTD